MKRWLLVRMVRALFVMAAVIVYHLLGYDFDLPTFILACVVFAGGDVVREVAE